ncbi:MAG: noncanonical pyrimidine nucleotidase, YjjG family [Bacteroidales bacterium]|nr:noncanonical pyrimidine nucleotidase, YjjG family [Bacteroidales bacterium]
MTINRYTHIFFDLDNTLWDFRANSFAALKIAYSNFKIESQYPDYQNFFDVFTEINDLLWSDYRKKLLVKKELQRLRFSMTFDRLEINGVDPLEMDSFYLSEIPKQKNLIDGASRVLQYLKSKGYLLFIITYGFKEVQTDKLKNSGLSQYFTRIYISEDIKAPKPGREIFEYAIKSANARKTKSIMVGDDWESDIEGALNFGVDAVYFCPSANRPVPLDCDRIYNRNKVFSINALSGLYDIL